MSVVDALAAAPNRLAANRDFIRLWIGQIATAFGNGVSQIAMPLLVLALTDSPAQAGLVAAARNAPYILLGLPAGALVDRWNRRTVLILCDASRGLAMASVPLAWVFGILTMPQLLIVALIQGAALTFSNLAQTAALPRLVQTGQIAAAQALNTSSLGVASLVGPGLGGVVVGLGRTTAAGAVIACVVDAASYTVSVAMLISIRRPFQSARTAAPRRLRQEIAEGLRYLWADRPIRLLAFVNMFHRFCIGPVVILAIVVFGREQLGATPAAIGVIVGAGGAGGLLGSAVTPALRRRLPVGWHMIGVVALDALGLAIVALSSSIPIAMVGMSIVGAAEAMTSIVQVSYRLATIPDRLQGRVNSVYRFGSFTAMTLGTTTVGLLLEALGPTTTLWLLAAYLGSIAAVVATTDVRRL